ncbi:MAG: tryptophan-rich sensory protein [Saprospiraceae bacterium]|nr:tryptophan-rich sensory protein [Bacteroidia bacterium]NNE14455.1 tryptophan-rich sensory protein [Saprospiraceae bacterium]NNL93030.1 tryptophan-rich sensory protein [Saprospiraceae bacterium]
MSDNIKILLITVSALLLGFVSGFSTNDAITTWYPTLNKPFFQPPNWLFGPVWTVLYIMIGISVGLILTKVENSELKKKALVVFGIQFVLNLIWSPIFFGLKQITLALIVIIILLVMIFYTIKLFSKLNNSSGKLLIPYFLWVTFATLLNGAIVYLN